MDRKYSCTSSGVSASPEGAGHAVLTSAAKFDQPLAGRRWATVVDLAIHLSKHTCVGRGRGTNGVLIERG